MPSDRLQAQQPQEVDPQEGADEGVAGADDKRQQVAQLPVVLEPFLDAPLLYNARNDLIPAPSHAMCHHIGTCEVPEYF